jgi:hypothetical protein
MGWLDALQIIGGGAGGYSEGYQWMKEQQARDEQNAALRQYREDNIAIAEAKAEDERRKERRRNDLIEEALKGVDPAVAPFVRAEAAGATIPSGAWPKPKPAVTTVNPADYPDLTPSALKALQAQVAANNLGVSLPASALVEKDPFEEAFAAAALEEAKKPYRLSEINEREAAKARYRKPEKSGGGAVAYSTAQKATAERWKQSELKALEKRARDDSGAVVMSAEELAAEKLRIENSYRSQLGLDPIAELGAEWTPKKPAPPVATKSARPAPSAAKAPLAPGQKIRLKNGSTVTVKKVYPDGSFDAE